MRNNLNLNSEKPPIIIIKEGAPLGYPGGEERWVETIANSLVEHGFTDVFVLQLVKEIYKDHLKPSQEEYKFKIFTFPHEYVLRPSFFKKLTQHANGGVVYYIPKYAWVAIQILLFSKVFTRNFKLVLGYHSSHYVESNHILDKISKKLGYLADLHHVLNSYHKTIIENSLIFLKRAKVVLLPNTFSLLNPHPCETDEIFLKKDSKVFRVLYVGRLEPIKGIDIILKALPHVKQLRDIKIEIFGTGSLENKIAELSRKYEFVDFYGFADIETLKSVYKKSHLVLIPSYREASPMVLNEALSFGCAVVASAITPIKDVLYSRSHPPKTAVKLFIPGDVKSFINTFRYFYEIWKAGDWEKVIKDAINSAVSFEEYFQKFLSEVLTNE